ncbi:Holliday junction branch migration protein RuvA, partial [bacterium]
MDAGRLRDAIAGGDVAGLCKISGVGKKMAERLVVELREKVGAFDTGVTLPDISSTTSGPLSEAEEALVSLGYPRPLAKKAVLAASPEGKDPVGEIIRSALRSLAPKR